MSENQDVIDKIEESELFKKKINECIIGIDSNKNQEFTATSFDHVNNGLEFLLKYIEDENFASINFDECDMINITKVLFEMIQYSINLFKDSLETEVSLNLDSFLFRLGTIFKDASHKSNQFVLYYHKTSEFSIQIIFDLLDILPDTKVNQFSNVVDIFLKTLISMSKLHIDFQKNWQNVSLEKFKLKFLTIDEVIDTKWSLFLIENNLEQKEKFLDPFFNFEENKNFQQNLELGIKFIKYLDSPELIYKSGHLTEFTTFLFTGLMTEKIQDENDLKYFINLSIKILDQYYSETVLLIESSEEEKKILKNISLIKGFSDCLSVLSNNFLSCSVIFLNNPNGIPVLFKYLNSQSFICYYLNHSNSLNCFASIICLLHNLSRLYYKYINEWNECDPVNVCLNFLEKTGDEFKLAGYLMIVNVATDNQIETLPEIRTAIKTITDMIKNCIDLLDNESEINRFPIQIEEDQEPVEVLIYIYNSDLWTITELLEGLYRMSVNDSIKKEIYEKLEMKIYLKKMILKGNIAEKSFAAKVLYQLCFDKNVINDLAKDKEFMECLKNLSNENSNVILKKSCDGILWKHHNIEECENENNNKFNEKHSRTENENKHIMISYNGESRQICLSIKLEMEKLGFKIWIDVENIAGSSLESMAEAIEQSFCVLMCMTEKYKMSPNCRLEAEYAVQLNKPIIPLILQKDYKPNGWLGIILGSKIYVNFKKYSFEECLRRVLHELKKIQIQPEISEKIEKVSVNSSLTKCQNENINKNENEKHKEIIKWNEEDFENWAREKLMNNRIIEYIRPCNGKILSQMNKMIQEDSKFFYSSIRADSNNKVSLRDFAEFSYEIKELFSS